MGFYDGENKGCSAYSISKLLNIPTILILDGSGSYITISAVLKGLLEYKKDNTIKAIVLNKLSSENHFQLIKQQIEKDHKNIIILGWIKKDLDSLTNTHLGLDLNSLNKIKHITKEILEYIDIRLLKKIVLKQKYSHKNTYYPFNKIKKIDKKLVIVYDKNFSFLYFDNLIFLKEVFRKIIIIDSTKDEVIPSDADIIYICGGYVETDIAYNRVINSKKFRKSLIKHSKTKNIYGECAGLLYLGNRVDDKKMTGILDIDFTLNNRFTRLGYYYNQSGMKGHCFHYTDILNDSSNYDILSKTKNGIGKNGSWYSKNNKIFGTYFHTMFRKNNQLII
jgi:cobyrinic acid a,c-diamide synthase